ncbi:MAG: hypothetical protein M3388_08480 [Acidobacteriota bacterium]|nr:hypothetical protein [Acidobacteriota bacterium]
MSQRNKNNSIIFLTTLSVYLGLVLVGATPNVLAQDSLSKLSQIKRDSKFVCPNNGLIGDEIGKELNPFDYDFAKRLIELIQTTDVRIEIVKANEPETLITPFYFKQIKFAPYINKKGKLEEFDWEDDSCEWASAAHAGQISEIHSLFLNPLCDCSEPSKQKIVLNSSYLKIDNDWLDSEFTIKKASKQRADQLAESLSQVFALRTSSSTNQAVKEVYKNTQIRSENNQVFIVTRLPRGSLDELLKQDAKAESK